MPFYLLAFIGAIASGFMVIVAKLSSKYSFKNPWVFAILLTYVSLLFVIPPALLNGAG